MATTRTIGPLHLEDLEPHRFEDLIRQLIYDFRNWRRLEATGRAGSDAGFDARGVEITAQVDPAVDLSDDGDDAAISAAIEDRMWLVQCKREKSITPKKLIGYLDAIPEEGRTGLYGIIFAAACDFSKAAQDAFRTKVTALAFAEAYLWGKGEIEDILFQPKNDHLLFAYFGVSLQLRRRNLKTEVRSRLAIKRKAIRSLQESQNVLIRDATDDRYPFLDPDKLKRREDRGRWCVMTYNGAFSDGIHLVYRRHFAYIGEDGKEWDYAECMDDGPVHSRDNPWTERDDYDDSDARAAAMEIWSALPEHTRAWYEMIAVLPYENILDIDEKGDEYLENPHIYTIEFTQERGPFFWFQRSLENNSRWNARSAIPDDTQRVNKFPRRTTKNDTSRG